jgi:sugar transferase (PEP-CTERM system associated)
LQCCWPTLGSHNNNGEYSVMHVGSLGTRIRTPLLLMALAELAVVFSSLYVAGILIYGTISNCEEILGPLAPRAGLISIVILGSLVAMGLYQFHTRIYFREVIFRVLAALLAGSALLAIVFYLFPATMVSTDIATVSITYAVVLLLLLRFFFLRHVDENIFRRRTLIYGAGKRSACLLEMRRRADRRGFKIVGRVAAPGDEIFGDTSDVIMPVGKSVADYAAERNAHEIVIAMDDRRGNLPVKDMLDARLRGIDVVDLLEFLERETGKIRIDLVNLGWLIFSPGFRISGIRIVSQRFVDLVVSTALILLTWPIMLLVAIAIKCEDGPKAPILYRQCRVGQGGRLFQVLKFRSMTVNAEADGKAVWAEENDTRITRVGNFLRFSRLDELPQVFNVLRGHMSLVGPRPERPEFVQELRECIPYYSERHSVKPGVTGWAQLRYSYGASKEDAIEKLQYDLYYIKNQSLMLDLLIILQTVEVVLWGKGAR